MNYSVARHYIPSGWKSTHILMFQKPGKDTMEAKNYRPISLLNTLSKLLETFIYDRLIESCGKQLSDNQSGFRRGRQTKDIMTEVIQTGQMVIQEKKRQNAMKIDKRKRMQILFVIKKKVQG